MGENCRRFHLVTLKCATATTYIGVSGVASLFNLNADEIYNQLPEEQRIQYDELIPDQNMRSQIVPGDFKFAEPDAIYHFLSRIDVTARADTQPLKTFILHEFPESGNSHFVLDDELRRAFDELESVVSTKDLKGNATHFSYSKFLSAWYHLSEMGKRPGVEWVSSFYRDMNTFPFEEAYKIIDSYSEHIVKYSKLLLVGHLIMFIHSKVIRDNEATRGINRRDMVTVSKHRLPNNNPLFALTSKHIHQIMPQKRRPDEKSLLLAKLKIHHHFKQRKVPTIGSSLIKYPNEETFSPSNTGPVFATLYNNLQVRTKLFLELANREVMGRANTIISLDVS